VDVAQGVVVGGGEYHADWYPESRTVTFGALINIRARQDNRSMEVQDPTLRMRIEQVVRAVFEGTGP
jgi:hypothetical protein